MSSSLGTAKTEARLRELRRALHRIPELGKREHKTQQLILGKLHEVKPDVVVPIDTGVKAVFFAKNPKADTLCFRADMDALCIQEETGLPFQSCTPGVMHACGHDGHTALLLEFAELLSARREELPNHVVLLFQPAEEGLGGARDMIAGGALKDPDVKAIFAFHLMPHIGQGRIGIKSGGMMAAASGFDITVQGKSTHAATPHMGTDALLAAAQLVVQLQSVVSRHTDPFAPCVVSIGKIAGGEARNIVAQEVRLQGTVRAYASALIEQTHSSIRAMAKGIEGMGVTTEFFEKTGYPAVLNDEKLAQKVKALAGDMAFCPTPMLTADDFAYYQEEVPGLYMFLGCRNEEKDCVYPLHSSRFNFDEAALLPGLELFWRIALCGEMI